MGQDHRRPEQERAGIDHPLERQDQRRRIIGERAPGVAGARRFGDLDVPFVSPAPFQRQRLDRAHAVDRLDQERSLGVLRPGDAPEPAPERPEVERDDDENDAAQSEHEQRKLPVENQQDRHQPEQGYQVEQRRRTAGRSGSCGSARSWPICETVSPVGVRSKYSIGSFSSLSMI